MKRLLLIALFFCDPVAAKSTHKRELSTIKAKQRYASIQYTRSPRLQAVAEGSPTITSASSIEIGLLAGLNLGYAQAEPTRSGSTRNAMALSVFLNAPLSENFSLAPELSLVQRGVRTELFNFSQGNIAGTIQLDTLEIPLLIRYRHCVSRSWSLMLIGGPYASVLLSRSIQVASLVEMDLSNRFKDFDAGVILGAGVMIPVGRRTQLLTITRYTLGLMNLDGNGNQFYTRGIQTLLGVQVGF